MRTILTFLFVFLADTINCQECPSNPDSSCNACVGDWNSPTFTQESGLSSDGTSCDVTVSWSFPNDDSLLSPRMTFLCSYDDGSYCFEAETDVCASCQSVAFSGLDLSRSPLLTYSDTCGHLEVLVIHSECNGGATTTTDQSTTKHVTTDITTTEIGTTEPPIVCQGAFTLIRDRCLFVDPFTLTRWDEARYFCSELGAELASLDNDDVYLATLDYIDESNLAGSFWVGASDRLIEGEYIWISGKEMEMGTPYWAINYFSNQTTAISQEPTNIGELGFDCIHMDGERFLFYDDDDCLSYKGLICEKN